MKRSLRPPSRKAEGLPNWVMTFADLMTLLLTFFILLLSFSTLDAARYKAIAQSMGQAFGVTWIQTAQGGREVTTDEAPAPPSPVEAAKPVTPEQPASPTPSELPATEPGLGAKPQPPKPEDLQNSEELATRLISAMEDEIAHRQLAVNFNAERVVMRFSEDSTFPSGSAELIPQTKPILDKVVEVLARCEGNIVVSGHSDDRPIYSGRFRSNWDLSTARAVSVVHELVLNREIDAARVVAAGRAETRPLVPNNSDENRARNRRVEIEIFNPRCTPVANG